MKTLKDLTQLEKDYLNHLISYRNKFWDENNFDKADQVEKEINEFMAK